MKNFLLLLVLATTLTTFTAPATFAATTCDRTVRSCGMVHFSTEAREAAKKPYIAAYVALGGDAADLEGMNRAQIMKATFELEKLLGIR